MFDAMSLLISSFPRRLRLRHHRKKRIATSSAATGDRVPFFLSSCGGGGGDVISPFVVKPKKAMRKLKEQAAKTSSSRRHWRARDDGKVHVDADDEEPCVWRRTILLGRRCQPLEFSGAIHYDSEGKLLLQARSPPTSPARSFDLD